MTIDDTPKDGDFASYLEHLSKRNATPAPADIPPATTSDVPSATKADEQEQPTSPNDIVLQLAIGIISESDEPMDEIADQLAGLETSAPLSDEELEQQALRHPGADGDSRTPE